MEENTEIKTYKIGPFRISKEISEHKRFSNITIIFIITTLVFAYTTSYFAYDNYKMHKKLNTQNIKISKLEKQKKRIAKILLKDMNMAIGYSNLLVFVTTTGNKYHRLYCHYVAEEKSINASHLELDIDKTGNFLVIMDAESQGYTPCKECCTDEARNKYLLSEYKSE